ncbi:hypothetical protein JAAARDRAFT_187513 [Jaapia argillacea MUCL 33604]|uniref:F-box domain-containing protein n=1 Tax=Jaapia argillacea MUCL 33604 TaxID=933084 RepID=A0A067QB03_9AGAM|nr:hypothetical protein JAAARDRAFT_187513 [Jaapia argillacea MUCL 33604]
MVLVCKAWYACGREFLYRNPIIPSPNHIHLFTRTVTKEPTLAKRVLSIVILRVPLFSPPNRIHSAVGFLRPSTTRQRIAQAVNVCANIQSLGLGCMEVLGARPTLATCLPEIPTFTRIRQLWICAASSGKPLTTTYILPPGIFPILEELVLEYFTLDYLLSWPSLPRLRSLRLSRCHLLKTGCLIPPSLRSLRSIELVTTTTTHPSAEDHVQALYRYKNILESLAITVSSRSAFRYPKLDLSRFIKLKHIVLDSRAFSSSLSGEHPCLIADRLPCSLLTIAIVDILGTAGVIKGVKPRYDHSSSYIRDSLVQNLGQLGSLPSLQTLYIEGRVQEWKATLPLLSALSTPRAIETNFLLFDDFPRPYSDYSQLRTYRARHLPWPWPLLLGTLCIAEEVVAPLLFVQ